jgi:hypothetical protein
MQPGTESQFCCGRRTQQGLACTSHFCSWELISFFRCVRSFSSVCFRCASGSSAAFGDFVPFGLVDVLMAGALTAGTLLAGVSLAFCLSFSTGALAGTASGLALPTSQAPLSVGGVCCQAPGCGSRGLRLCRGSRSQ